MTFEEILPGLKAKKKYVRTGWGGAENYVQLFYFKGVGGIYECKSNCTDYSYFKS